MTDHAISHEHPPATAPADHGGGGLAANLQIAAVAVGALVAALAQTLIIPVLPTMAADLDTSPGNAQWC
jgi:hypothetical protein